MSVIAVTDFCASVLCRQVPWHAAYRLVFALKLALELARLSGVVVEHALLIRVFIHVTTFPYLEKGLLELGNETAS